MGAEAAESEALDDGAVRVERGERGRSRFDRLAQRASHVASSAWFFVLCAAMIAAWAASYVLGADITIRTFAGEAMTALTLLLVALLKNADLRSEAAIQLKLDAIATADWVIDLGPGGGDAGGQVVATGTPADVASAEGSATAPYLARRLAHRPRARVEQDLG